MDGFRFRDSISYFSIYVLKLLIVVWAFLFYGTVGLLLLTVIYIAIRKRVRKSILANNDNYIQFLKDNLQNQKKYNSKISEILKDMDLFDSNDETQNNNENEDNDKKSDDNMSSNINIIQTRVYGRSKIFFGNILI